ncbi:hypothetical protein NDU88_007373 [Pleurodeles waltl]|uniref:Uncharacterized protein n=1 Tax=Pleurodeles waltl TaxID=8319 RepID=A0AAV7VTC4_PLEWA|nr:hypothetical protein NDU88_007373 [Pleurodeles waltl]
MIIELVSKWGVADSPARCPLHREALPAGDQERASYPPFTAFFPVYNAWAVLEGLWRLQTGASFYTCAGGAHLPPFLCRGLVGSRGACGPFLLRLALRSGAVGAAGGGSPLLHRPCPRVQEAEAQRGLCRPRWLALSYPAPAGPYGRRLGPRAAMGLRGRGSVLTQGGVSPLLLKAVQPFWAAFVRCQGAQDLLQPPGLLDGGAAL